MPDRRAIQQRIHRSAARAALFAPRWYDRADVPREVWFSDRRRDLMIAAVVAVALAVFGVATHGGLSLSESTYASRDRSDSRIYLSMAAHRWIDGPPLGGIPEEYSLYNVPLPFRYRVLVPWL